MNIPLLDKLKQRLGGLFGKNAGNQMVGIALHGKCVRMAKGEIVGGQWQFECEEQIDVDSEEQWPSVVNALIETHDLKNALCTLVLPGNRYQLLQIDKPALEEEELAASLAWTVKDLVTLPAEELVADYFTVPKNVPNLSNKLNVVVTSNKTILPIVDIFIRRKVELYGIVPEELVIRNVIGPTEAASMLLSQQAGEEITLQIVKKDELYFARRLRGFNRLNDYSAEELAPGMTDSLSLEIQRSMDYYESMLKQAPIKNVQLALPTEHQQLIADQIASHFPLEVITMPVSSSLVQLEQGLNEQFFPALGGALEPLMADAGGSGE